MDKKDSILTKTYHFFREWEPDMISRYYASEREWQKHQYGYLTGKENDYYNGGNASNTDEEKRKHVEKNLLQIIEKDHLYALSYLLKGAIPEGTLNEWISVWDNDGKEQCIKDIVNHAKYEYLDILEGLSRGYLVEWLYLLTISEPDGFVELVKSPPQFYDDNWKDEFEDYSKTTGEKMKTWKHDKNLYYPCYFYHYIDDGLMFKIMFEGMNRKEDKTIYSRILRPKNKHIKKLLQKHYLLGDIKEIYQEVWNEVGDDLAWDKDLFLEPASEKDIQYPPFPDGYEKFAKNHITSSGFIKKDNKSKVLLKFESQVFLEALLKELYQFWHENKSDATDKSTRKTWKKIFDHLREKGILTEGRPPIKPFIDIIIKYCHKDANESKYRDVLRDGKVKLKITQKENEEWCDKMMEEATECIDNFWEEWLKVRRN